MPRNKYKRQSESSPFRVRRGDIFYADLGDEEDVVGSEQYGIRPVVVTQCNRKNANSTTYIVAVITSEIKKERMDSHVVLPFVRGLPKQSMVCCEQRFTIDRLRLLEYRAHLGKKLMKNITRACRKAEAEDRSKLPRYWKGKRSNKVRKGGNPNDR